MKEKSNLSGCDGKNAMEYRRKVWLSSKFDIHGQEKIIFQSLSFYKLEFNCYSLIKHINHINTIRPFKKTSLKKLV